MTDAETILEFIRDEADLDEDEVSADTSLFRDQLLDSMNLTALIAFLEETFAIKVKPMDIVFENLDTVNHMLAYVGAQEGGRCLRPGVDTQPESNAQSCAGVRAARALVLLRPRPEPADLSLVPALPGYHRRRARRRQAHRVPLRRLLTRPRRPMTPAPLMTDAVARLRRWATECGDATLLRTRGRAYTYADMQSRAERVACALLAASGRRGARVALALEEYDQFFVCMLGAWLAGSVVVPLNTSLPQNDVDWLVGKCRADVIVLPDDDACPRPREVLCGWS